MYGKQYGRSGSPEFKIIDSVYIVMYIEIEINIRSGQNQ